MRIYGKENKDWIEDFNKIMKQHYICYMESEKLKVVNWYFGNEDKLANDFNEAYNDKDYKTMNKIICSMISDISLYELYKERGKELYK